MSSSFNFVPRGRPKNIQACSFNSMVREDDFKITQSIFCGLNGESSRESHRKKKYGLFKTLDELRQVCLYGRPRSNPLSRIPNVIFAVTIGSELQEDSETLASVKRLTSARSTQSRPFTPKPQDHDERDKKSNMTSLSCRVPVSTEMHIHNVSLDGSLLPLKKRIVSNTAVETNETNRSTEVTSNRNWLSNLNGTFPSTLKALIRQLVVKSEDQASNVGICKKEEGKLTKRIDKPSSMILRQRLIQLDTDRQIALLKFYCQRLTSKGNKPATQNRASQKLPYLFKNLNERVLNQISLFIEEYEQLAPKVAKNVKAFERIAKKPPLLRKVLQDLQNKDDENDLYYLEDLLICIASGTEYIEKSKSQLVSILDDLVDRALKSSFEAQISKFLRAAHAICRFNVLQAEADLQMLRSKWLKLSSPQ